MNDTDVIKLLRKRQGDRTQSDVARELEVTPQYLSEVLKGLKPPSERILDYLGLKRVVEIVKAK